MGTIVNVPITLNLAGDVNDNPRVVGYLGDQDTITVNVTVVNEADLVNLSEWNIMFAAALPDGIHYIEDKGDAYGNLVIIDGENGRFDYTFTKEAFSVVGIVDNARFILSKNNPELQSEMDIKSTCSFEFEVKSDALQGKISVDDFSSDIVKFEKDLIYLSDEISDLDTKIDAETSKLQTEADDLQQQFDNLDPTQFLPKSGGTMTGALQFDGIPTLFQAKLNSVWWYRLTSENSTTYQQSLYPTIVSGINGVQGAGYNFKQTYLRLNNVDVETVAGSQAKADKALDDAKTSAASLYEPKITKTAWTAPVLNSGFSILDSRFPILYRLKGSTLQIKGAVGRTSAKGAMFNLPVGFRTSERRGFSVSLVSSVGGNVGTVYFQTNGDVELVAASQDSPVWVEVSFDID
ncbi:BppU family phage baseplate upper protein [Listeria seeligeri]|uniref:BppU family phage baseplate upper protein n=1 Tax=Listeria seeligeri TaxID=1640 RepID=UPI0016259E97|nr:BppU family phage baseplate upper protein [Listeria seeligeri]MBC1734949.1 BppU family phage baseplate upper protein [Listeria seeligeri]